MEQHHRRFAYLGAMGIVNESFFMLVDCCFCGDDKKGQRQNFPGLAAFQFQAIQGIAVNVHQTEMVNAINSCNGGGGDQHAKERVDSIAV